MWPHRLHCGILYDCGVPMAWLLIFLLQLGYLTSAVDSQYLQNDTVVCTGRQARFRWEYEVKPFIAIVWNHKGNKIASSSSLFFSPEEIISDQFKGRLTFNSTDPFSFTLEKTTIGDNGSYECVFAFADGLMDTLVGNLEVKDLVLDDSLMVEVKKNDRCVTLSCNTDPPCTWTYPNGTTEVAETIHFCSKESNETVKCESEHACTYGTYTMIFSGEPKDPANVTVSIVGGIIGGLVIVAVIVIIVYLRRRCKEQQTSRKCRQENEDGNKTFIS